MAVEQVAAKDLKCGDIVTSGDESYVIKEIDVDGSNLCVSFWGTSQAMSIHPNSHLLVENMNSVYEESTPPTKSKGGTSIRTEFSTADEGRNPSGYGSYNNVGEGWSYDD